jgi:hypothetical protein
LHVGVDEFIEGVDDSLKNANIPNLRAIRIHTNLDFDLIDISVMVAIVV